MRAREDFPMPIRMHPMKFARLLYEKEKELDNEDSRSEATQRPRFG
jgi:hypothetical protein